MKVFGGGTILIILLYHIFDRFSQLYLKSSIKLMDLRGTFGVCIFFIISCWFLLDFDKEHGDFSLKNFLIKKIKRLWPIYVISLLIIFIVTHICYLPKRMCAFLYLILNILFLNGFVGTSYVDGAHWYLTVLISFIILVGLGKKYKLYKIPLFYIVCLLINFIAYKLHIIFIFNLFSGNYISYLCLIAGVKGLMFNKRNMQWLFVIFISLTSMILKNGIINIIVFIIAFILFLFCLNEKLKIFQNKYLFIIGELSYPLYLIHQNISFEIEYLMLDHLGYYSFLFGVVAIIVSFLLVILLNKIDVTIHKNFLKNF